MGEPHGKVLLLNSVRDRMKTVMPQARRPSRLWDAEWDGFEIRPTDWAGEGFA